MNKLLEMLLIGAVKSRLPGVAKGYEKYSQFAVPLIRARRYYRRYKGQGLDTQTAAMAAATDAHVPLDMLLDYLKGKTGDFGDVAISEVLNGTAYDGTHGFHSGADQ